MDVLHVRTKSLVDLLLQGSGIVLDVHQIPKGIIVSSAAIRHHTGSAESLSA